MINLNSFLDNKLSSLLPLNAKIKETGEKNVNEVNVKVEMMNDVKMIKILNIRKIKEKHILKFIENHQLLSKNCSLITYPFQIQHIGCNMILLSRKYYTRDLEELIKGKSLTNRLICNVICYICNTLIILSENDIIVDNLKSSNVIYKVNNNMLLCDLFLNALGNDDEMRVYDICFKSPEELSGLECDEKSVIWSIGCILYEMICKKLPFEEDNNVFQILE